MHEIINTEEVKNIKKKEIKNKIYRYKSKI